MNLITVTIEKCAITVMKPSFGGSFFGGGVVGGWLGCVRFISGFIWNIIRYNTSCIRWDSDYTGVRRCRAFFLPNYLWNIYNGSVDCYAVSLSRIYIINHRSINKSLKGCNDFATTVYICKTIFKKKQPSRY